ncbi:hypothetical protein BJ878DRAFT_525319 [Calycina marina]|uniref:Uncharacterized protein n=1 Tax=Calycina marina TaxID=1763456 RepID=A0A9P7YWL6_9HELO|nr:hypothetical protein BJ878DRAFT_525319 [Calycina marina]
MPLPPAGAPGGLPLSINLPNSINKRKRDAELRTPTSRENNKFNIEGAAQNSQRVITPVAIPTGPSPKSTDRAYDFSPSANVSEPRMFLAHDGYVPERARGRSRNLDLPHGTERYDDRSAPTTGPGVDRYIPRRSVELRDRERPDRRPISPSDYGWGRNTNCYDSPRGGEYRDRPRIQSTSFSLPQPRATVFPVNKPHISINDSSREYRAARAEEYRRSLGLIDPYVHPSRQGLVRQDSKLTDRSTEVIASQLVVEKHTVEKPNNQPLAVQSPLMVNMSTEEPFMEDEHMATELSDFPIQDNTGKPNFLMAEVLKEISSHAALQVQKCFADQALRGLSRREKDMAKSQTLDKFPSIQNAIAMPRERLLREAREVAEKITAHDAVLEDIGHKFFTSRNTGDGGKVRTELSAVKKDTENLLFMTNTLVGESDNFQKFMKESREQHASVMAVVEALKSANSDLKKEQETSRNLYQAYSSSQQALESTVAVLKEVQEGFTAKITSLQKELSTTLKLGMSELKKALPKLEERLAKVEQSNNDVGKLTARLGDYDNARNESQVDHEGLRHMSEHSTDIHAVQESPAKDYGKREAFKTRATSPENVQKALLQAKPSLETRLLQVETRTKAIETLPVQVDALEQRTRVMETKVAQRTVHNYDTSPIGVSKLSQPSNLELRLDALESRPPLSEEYRNALKKEFLEGVQAVEEVTLQVFSDEINKSNATISRNTNRAIALEASVPRFVERITDLERSVTAAKADLVTMNGKIEVLDTFSTTAKVNIERSQERINTLKSGSPDNALQAELNSLKQSIDSNKFDVERLDQEMAYANKSIPAAAYGQVWATLQPSLDGLNKRFDQQTGHFNNMSAHVNEVNFRIDQLDSRMNNISTKEQAHYIISQIAEQYPFLRAAIDTAGIKADLEALARRVATTEGRDTASVSDGNALVYAPLRADVDKLGKKVSDLQSTVGTLQKTTRDEKKEADEANESLATEIATLEVNNELMDKRIDKVESGLQKRIAAVEKSQQSTNTDMSNLKNYQSKSECDIVNIKDARAKLQTDIITIKTEQAKAGGDIDKFAKDQENILRDVTTIKTAQAKLESGVDSIKQIQKEIQQTQQSDKSIEQSKSLKDMEKAVNEMQGQVKDINNQVEKDLSASKPRSRAVLVYASPHDAPPAPKPGAQRQQPTLVQRAASNQSNSRINGKKTASNGVRHSVKSSSQFGMKRATPGTNGHSRPPPSKKPKIEPDREESDDDKNFVAPLRRSVHIVMDSSDEN